ncbi:hypothetical protein K435DRAFT_880592 [Dendrothele bispora CBS 962.96]|uniref:Uncharacterized protein n=1 Tax=Dendrothele bispora (strain CBS 962.96) TaxID=1314807 RepID=A0A4S8KJH3_DENBC|nr:hypothetical protein K435DRAFT_880592 [Dendrothele bispora CBS 962.96]
MTKPLGTLKSTELEIAGKELAELRQKVANLPYKDNIIQLLQQEISTLKQELETCTGKLQQTEASNSTLSNHLQRGQLLQLMESGEVLLHLRSIFEAHATSMNNSMENLAVRVAERLKPVKEAPVTPPCEIPHVPSVGLEPQNIPEVQPNSPIIQPMVVDDENISKADAFRSLMNTFKRLSQNDPSRLSHSPNATHPNATHPNATHPNAMHPNAMHPNAMHLNAMHPNAMHPNAIHSNAMHPNAIHSNAMHPNAMHPNAMHPNAMHPNPREDFSQMTGQGQTFHMPNDNPGSQRSTIAPAIPNPATPYSAFGSVGVGQHHTSDRQLPRPLPPPKTYPTPNINATWNFPLGGSEPGQL